MCSQCDEINVRIRHLQEIARRMVDQQTLNGIAELVSTLEAQKLALYPE